MAGPAWWQVPVALRPGWLISSGQRQDSRIRWKQLGYEEVWAEHLVLCPPDSTKFLFFCIFQGQRVAELILHHARASECKDVERFKAEMATLVTQARKNTITLEKVSRPLALPLDRTNPKLKEDLLMGRSLEGVRVLRQIKKKPFLCPHLPGVRRLTEISGSQRWLLGHDLYSVTPLPV